MKQTISLVTLVVKNVANSLAFYEAGLQFNPIFQNEVVAFFQMNGFIFGLFEKDAFEKETGRKAASGNLNAALAHNVASEAEVDQVLILVKDAGAKIEKEAVKRDWGGYSGYFSDPDGHLWEVAFNPLWKISPEGYVTVQ